MRTLEDQLSDYGAYRADSQPPIIAEEVVLAGGMPEITAQPSRPGWLVGVAAAVVVLLIGAVSLVLMRDPRSEVADPTPAPSTPSVVPDLSEDAIVTESTDGTFQVTWTPFDSRMLPASMSQIWTSPPDLAKIDSSDYASDSNQGPVWVIPSTVCHSGGCGWAETSDGEQWVQAGPQPPGFGRFHTWAEQGVLLDFKELPGLSSTIPDKIAIGGPLPYGEVTVSSRDGHIEGVGVCVNPVLPERWDALNVVVPPDAFTTWYGDPVPATSLWMSFGQPPYSLEANPPDWWDHGAYACSAGYLDGTLYAFTPALNASYLTAEDYAQEPDYLKEAQLWKLQDGDWVEMPFEYDFQFPVHQVTFAGDRVFVFAGKVRGRRLIYTSTDFADWKVIQQLDTGYPFEIEWEIRATDFGWLAVAINSQELFLSTDGTNWESLAHPGFTSSDPGPIDEIYVSYADGLFIITERRSGDGFNNVADWVGKLTR